MPITDPVQADHRLKKDLGLFDVFAVSTGAMFSSGFFLLPGLAFAKAGPAVILSYLVAGLLILPAMFSKAELSTALPRAGGTYYFLDRSLGPLAGTVGGLGTYFALTLKTAFALIGIGAYAAYFVELPIKPVAIALTVVFIIINACGAKETTALQRWLVIVLLTVMALFLVQGLVFLGGQPIETTRARMTPFFNENALTILSTAGFVFVSYAGLTKVASVAEEVHHPDRNIPLGMMLSLSVTALVYAIGVFVIVAVVDPVVLATDLTPVATAADSIFSWLPAKAGLLLVVIAALAAFASTGNAGLLAASRYPYAMARDRLLPERLSKLGRFRTPVAAILMTGGLMIACILLLDAEGIAKLASAFQLFIFMLVNLAVIVMRESRIASYDPGYRSPLYPWMQVFGIITSGLLILYMGPQAIAFTVGVVLICLIWYRFYCSDRVERDGAIYHWFERLGRKQYEGLDREFRGIMKEKGLREQDPFDDIIARCIVIDLQDRLEFDEIVKRAATEFTRRIPNTAEEITERFLHGTRTGDTPVSHGVALPHFRTVSIEKAELVLVRCRYDVAVPADDPLTEEIEPPQPVHAIFFLVSPESDPALHLRILAQIAGRVDEPSFADAWRDARDEHEIREVLLRDDRFVTLVADPNSRTSDMVGKFVRDLGLPEGTLVAVIRRAGSVLIPRGSTRIEAGDRVTIIGVPEDIQQLHEQYGLSRRVSDGDSAADEDASD
ncbi:MAG: amino acid permease [Planctomycetota bacterium]